jgi:hypothetical protein
MAWCHKSEPRASCHVMDGKRQLGRVRPESEAVPPKLVAAGLMRKELPGTTNGVEVLSLSLDREGTAAVEEVIARATARLAEIHNAAQERIDRGQARPLATQTGIAFGIRRRH